MLRVIFLHVPWGKYIALLDSGLVLKSHEQTLTKAGRCHQAALWKRPAGPASFLQPLRVPSALLPFKRLSFFAAP